MKNFSGVPNRSPGGEGDSPSPVGRGTPLPTPYPLGAFGASILAPAAPRPAPPVQL